MKIAVIFAILAIPVSLFALTYSGGSGKGGVSSGSAADGFTADRVPFINTSGEWAEDSNLRYIQGGANGDQLWLTNASIDKPSLTTSADSGLTGINILNAIIDFHIGAGGTKIEVTSNQTKFNHKGRVASAPDIAGSNTAGDTGMYWEAYPGAGNDDRLSFSAASSRVISISSNTLTIGKPAGTFNRTSAQLSALSCEDGAGCIVFCSDCATPNVYVSTGTGTGAWVSTADGTTEE